MKLKRKPRTLLVSNDAALTASPAHPWALDDYDMKSATYVWRSHDGDIDWWHYRNEAWYRTKCTALVAVLILLFPLTISLIAAIALAEWKTQRTLVLRGYANPDANLYKCLGRSHNYYDQFDYALYPYAWIIKLWRWYKLNRWALDKIAINWGFKIHEGAAFYSTAKWCWPGRGGVVINWHGDPVIMTSRLGRRTGRNLQSREVVWTSRE